MIPGVDQQPENKPQPTDEENIGGQKETIDETVEDNPQADFAEVASNQAAREAGQRARKLAGDFAKKSSDLAKIAWQKSVLWLAGTLGISGSIAGAIIIIVIIFIFGLILFANLGDARSGSTALQENESSDKIIELLSKTGDDNAFRQQLIESRPEIDKTFNKIRVNINKKINNNKFNETQKAKSTELIKLLDDTDNLINQTIASPNANTNAKILENYKAIQALNFSIFVVSTPSDQVINQVLELEKNNKIVGVKWAKWDSAFHSDVAKGLMDEKALRIMIALSDKYTIGICATKSDHKKHTSNGKNISLHYYGKAFDVCKINGKAITPQLTEAQEMMKWFEDNKNFLTSVEGADKHGIYPRELIGPHTFKQWAISRWNKKSYYVSGHDNHIHIGV